MPVTIIPSDVLQLAGTKAKVVTAGDIIEAGDFVFKDNSDGGRYNHCSSASANTPVQAVALNNASRDQPLSIVETGATVYLGSEVLVPGEFYFAGDQPGKIFSLTEIAEQEGYRHLAGYAFGESSLVMKTQAGGSLVPLES